ncbi:MAG: hypothetical protein ACTSV2_08385 [Candidatus Thorarchaeota archaeon]
MRKETNKPRKLFGKIDAEKEWIRIVDERDRKQFEKDEEQRRQQVQEVLDLIETRDYEKELSVFRDWMSKRKKNRES